MTELKTPTAVLREGPRSLSDAETAAIEGGDLHGIRQVDIDDVIEYVHHGLRQLPDFVPTSFPTVSAVTAPAPGPTSAALSPSNG